ncbi:hypothetical protein CKS_1814 [Pantoea stewartii subsp. stewartii DC283]|uniref:Uncharacterized protein n=1 Tax=Pantoea stewartii subsp. stewartii DC283 TaxID=660596 RepID=H3RFN4_PANSE|nr:hypothetical protein CKS_1814 [Pantoea stewartii subsp. stewartii DC283]
MAHEAGVNSEKRKAASVAPAHYPDRIASKYLLEWINAEMKGNAAGVTL